LNGFCKNGTQCEYIHQVESSNEVPICPFFQTTNGCKYGDSCYKRHILIEDDVSNSNETTNENIEKSNSIANFFVQQYYSQLVDGFDDENGIQATVMQPKTVFKINGEPVKGIQNIIQKLAILRGVQLGLESTDVQIKLDSSIEINCKGFMKDSSERSVRFIQNFVVKTNGTKFELVSSDLAWSIM